MNLACVTPPSDRILVTGSNGFIGAKVVELLLKYGFNNLRCFVRPSSNLTKISAIVSEHGGEAQIQVVNGNLLSREDCLNAAKDVAVIYHLAAGRGEKSFPDAFMNSVVTTRNLLDASLRHRCLKRFVSVSSFTVYSNQCRSPGKVLDEFCPMEERAELRGEAYCFAKVKQDELVMDYGKKYDLPYVLVRPGSVYGPGNEGISARVGIDSFGLFLHLGGSNKIPLTYVDNCAEAIVLKRGVDGQIFNVIDDNLPLSREFLRLYKREVKSFRSLYLPPAVSYLLCYFWEKYSNWSQGQLPPVYNRRTWHAYWKGSNYTNEKLKSVLGWKPIISMSEGLRLHFESCRKKEEHA